MLYLRLELLRLLMQIAYIYDTQITQIFHCNIKAAMPE